MTVRWMTPEDEYHVRALFMLCHPDWPARPKHWFQAHPTLVIPTTTRIAGFTSFTLSPATGGLHAYLMDTCVHPDLQGKGLGRRLFNEREKIVTDLGATLLVGITAPSNEPMKHLLASNGFVERDTIAEAFPNEPGVLWMR